MATWLLGKALFPIGAFGASGLSIFGLLKFSGPAKTQGVYMVVQTAVEPLAKGTKELINNKDGKRIKKYICKLNKTSFKDETCLLYRLNNQNATGADLSIELRGNKFDISQLIKTNTEIVKQQHYLLKISQEFYEQLSRTNKNDDDSDIKAQDIEIVNLEEQGKHFGVFSKTFNITEDEDESVQNPKIDLFLARFTKNSDKKEEIGEDEYTCTFNRLLHTSCKLYELGASEKQKTNNLTKVDVSNLVSPSEKADSNTINSTAGTTKTDTTDQYMVIQLLNKRLDVNYLKNKSIQVKKNRSSNNEIIELAEVVFDQPLFGVVDPDSPESSTVFVQTADKASFVGVPWTATDAAGTQDTQNTVPTGTTTYRCSFNLPNEQKSYDDSCLINPVSAKSGASLISFKELKEANQAFQPTSALAITTSHFYKVTIDKNKLHNLPIDPSNKIDGPNERILIDVWANTPSTTSRSSSSVSSSSSTDKGPTKIGSIELKHLIGETEVVGKTNLALARVKASRVISSPQETSNFCKINSFIHRVDCDVFAANLTSDDATDNSIKITGTKLDQNETFSIGSLYAIRFNIRSNIKSLRGKTVIATLTDASDIAKEVELEIENLMGGQLTTNLQQYLFDDFVK